MNSRKFWCNFKSSLCADDCHCLLHDLVVSYHAEMNDKTALSINDLTEMIREGVEANTGSLLKINQQHRKI